MQVTLTKIGEFTPNQNGIDIGYSKTGELLYPVEVGLPVYIMSGWNSFQTTEVSEILKTEQDKVVKFRTKNSTYTLNYK